MSSVYVEERQSEFWTSRQIDEFLLNAGHKVRICPLGQHMEKHLPADHLFSIDYPVKLFGIQYKALYHNGTDGWILPYAQYKTMGNFPWIYYGLSTLKDLSAPRNSLFFLRLMQHDDVDSTRDGIKEYANHYYVELKPRAFYYTLWGEFYRRLVACEVGMQADTQEQLTGSIRSLLEALPISDREQNTILDVFAINLGNMNTVKLSSTLRQDHG